MPLRIAVNDPGALIARCEYAMVRTAKGQPEYEDGALMPSGLWLGRWVRGLWSLWSELGSISRNRKGPSLEGGSVGSARYWFRAVAHGRARPRERRRPPSSGWEGAAAVGVGA